VKRTRSAYTLLAAWLLTLGGLGYYVYANLQIGADLRLFMPNPVTPAQRLLLNEIGEGPASRVLVIEIDGAPAAELADASRELAARLSTNREFRLVTNGDMSFDSIPDELLPYRYLLSSTLDRQALDEAYLHQSLLARARDLASPAASFLEPILPRDPTLEILNLVQSWQPMEEPNRLYDVWFDREGKRALLIAETSGAAFDPDKQQAALTELQHAFDEVRGNRALHYYVSGPGVFSVQIRNHTQNEAQWLGTFDTIGMLILTFIAYRRVSRIFLSILPLLSAGLAGLFAVSAFFGAVHGITLAFGFTLIGVAQDYPVHLLSHEHPGRSPLDIARQLWPTLATGVASTCIAYLAFFFSGVNGLAQLACMAIFGLGAAGLTTRFVLPYLIDDAQRDHGDSTFLGKLWMHIAALPRPGVGAVVLAIAAIVAIVAVRTPMWENDLGKLTPVPEDLLMRDQAIRSQLGTPDLRYLWVVESPTSDGALARLEALQPQLQHLVDTKVISAYDDAARYIPSAARQLERRAKLPDASTLKAALERASGGTPFREGVFQPFLDDVGQARSFAPLTVEKLHDSPLGASIDVLIMPRENKTTALITFVNVTDAQALTDAAHAAGPDVLLLDLKDASETLVAHQRERILWSLVIASVLLVGVIAVTLRNSGRVLRVLAPMVLTTILIIAVLQLTQTSLTLFHLIALILAAGLGLDYALFFEHVADEPHEQRRTLHAVLVSALSTLMVFGLLSFASTPVLRAIGTTVSLGVIFNFILALLLTRPARTHAPS
jgi:predicted exporter